MRFEMKFPSEGSATCPTAADASRTDREWVGESTERGWSVRTCLGRLKKKQRLYPSEPRPLGSWSGERTELPLLR